MIFHENIKLIIADNSLEFIEGLCILLSNSVKYQIIKVFTDGEELLNFPGLSDADIILADIELRKICGLEVAKQISSRYPNLLLIAISMYTEKVYLYEIIEAGFKAFIYKPDAVNTLCTVIEKVSNGKYVFPEML